MKLTPRHNHTVDLSLIPRISKDRKVRTALARECIMWFLNVYLADYAKKPPADFHKEMYAIAENTEIIQAVIVAFRGSAKSTIITLAYVIWSILGVQQKKFIVILGQTQRQARQHLQNIKEALEANDLLRTDLGPFKEMSDEWGAYALVIPKYGAKIIAVSIEQTVRGMRHKQHRPDLIVADDIEDIQSVKTKDGRDKIYQWVKSEVLLAGDETTRFMFVGNLLHQDSMPMRLKEEVGKDSQDKIFVQYPIADDLGNPSWPAKFSKEVIEKMREEIHNEPTFLRELMLKIVPHEGQVILPEWIHYHKGIPALYDTYRVITGVDLAISQSDMADYTAMVSVYVESGGPKIKIYVFENSINQRLDFPQAIETAVALSKTLGRGRPTKVVSEEVAYQSAFYQQLKKQHNIPAGGFKVGNLDKRTRLSLISKLIASGQILFPEKGAEDLIRQIVDYGVEDHDDLMDAFVIAVNAALEKFGSYGGFIVKESPDRI